MVNFRSQVYFVGAGPGDPELITINGQKCIWQADLVLTAGVPSIDLLAKEKDLAIANLEAVKFINMAILMGEPIQIYDSKDRFGLRDQERAKFTVNNHP